MDSAIYTAYLVTFAVPTAWWARRRIRYERMRWLVSQAVAEWVRVTVAAERHGSSVTEVSASMRAFAAAWAEEP